MSGIFKTYEKYKELSRRAGLYAYDYDYFMENEIYEYIIDTLGYPLDMHFYLGCIRIAVIGPHIPHIHVEHVDWNVGYTPVKYSRRISFYRKVIDRVLPFAEKERERKKWYTDYV